MDALLANPDTDNEMLQSGDIYKKYDQVKTSLASEMKIWEELHLEIEELQKRNDAG
jgi:hypothetical protein